MWPMVIHNCLSNGNSIGLGSPAHGIVTKIVHKTLPGGRESSVGGLVEVGQKMGDGGLGRD